MNLNVKRIFIFFTLVVIGGVLVILDLMLLLFGGELLAEQPIPDIPAHAIVTQCFSHHTYLCKHIEYSTGTLPADIASSWSSPYEILSDDGVGIVYSTSTCNDGWLGRHYASFQRDKNKVCMNQIAFFDEAKKRTEVVITVKWPNCPAIVDRYFQINPYFPCYQG